MDHGITIGHPLIDAQHTELLACIRRLRNLAACNPDQELVSEQLGRITSLAVAHFEAEEQLMATLALPAGHLLAHREDHRRIMNEVTDFHLESMGGHHATFETTVAKVHNWIVVHLHEFDSHLMPFFASDTAA